MSASDAAQSKAMGMDRIVTIARPDRKFAKHVHDELEPTGAERVE